MVPRRRGIAAAGETSRREEEREGIEAKCSRHPCPARHKERAKRGPDHTAYHVAELNERVRWLQQDTFVHELRHHRHVRRLKEAVGQAKEQREGEQVPELEDVEQGERCNHRHHHSSPRI